MAGNDTTGMYSPPTGPLADDKSSMKVIGGTHRVSTAIDPARAERGEYTPIEGDMMPAGTPVEGPPTGQPYTTNN